MLVNWGRLLILLVCAVVLRCQALHRSVHGFVSLSFIRRRHCYARWATHQALPCIFSYFIMWEGVVGRSREDTGWCDVSVHGEEAMSGAVHVGRCRWTVAITGDSHRHRARERERYFQHVLYKSDTLPVPQVSRHLF